MNQAATTLEDRLARICILLDAASRTLWATQDRDAMQVAVAMDEAQSLAGALLHRGIDGSAIEPGSQSVQSLLDEAVTESWSVPTCTPDGRPTAVFLAHLLALPRLYQECMS